MGEDQDRSVASTTLAPSMNAYGNLLGVVLYLLTEGGTNPHCTHTPQQDWPTGLDCSLTVDPLGASLTTAMQSSSSVMLEAINWMDSSPTWEELVAATTCSTWERFFECRTQDPCDPNCGVLNDSLDEQDAVMDAFEAVGVQFTRQYCSPGWSPICCATPCD